MKCPLFALAAIVCKSNTPKNVTDCLQTECAWWIDDIRMCAVKDLALETRHLQHRAQDIADRIVPPAQLP